MASQEEVDIISKTVKLNANNEMRTLEYIYTHKSKVSTVTPQLDNNGNTIGDDLVADRDDEEFARMTCNKAGTIGSIQCDASVGDPRRSASWDFGFDNSGNGVWTFSVSSAENSISEAYDGDWGPNSGGGYSKGSGLGTFNDTSYGNGWRTFFTGSQIFFIFTDIYDATQFMFMFDNFPSPLYFNIEPWSYAYIMHDEVV